MKGNRSRAYKNDIGTHKSVKFRRREMDEGIGPCSPAPIISLPEQEHKIRIDSWPHNCIC